MHWLALNTSGISDHCRSHLQKLDAAQQQPGLVSAMMAPTTLAALPLPPPFVVMVLHGIDTKTQSRLVVLITRFCCFQAIDKKVVVVVVVVGEEEVVVQKQQQGLEQQQDWKRRLCEVAGAWLSQRRLQAAPDSSSAVPLQAVLACLHCATAGARCAAGPATAVRLSAGCPQPPVPAAAAGSAGSRPRSPPQMCSASLSQPSLSSSCPRTRSPS